MKSLHLFVHLVFIERLLYATRCSNCWDCVMQTTDKVTALTKTSVHHVSCGQCDREEQRTKDDRARGIKESHSLGDGEVKA